MRSQRRRSGILRTARGQNGNPGYTPRPPAGRELLDIDSSSMGIISAGVTEGVGMTRMPVRGTRYVLSLLFASAPLSVILVVMGTGTLTLGSAALKQPPIPPASPLAQPTSLKHVGTPTDHTR